MMIVLTSCKPEQSRSGPDQSPLLSPFPTSIQPTAVAIPLPVPTSYPTIVVYVTGPTTGTRATSSPGITVTASGHGPTVVPLGPSVLTLEPSPTLPPEVQALGPNGVLVSLRSINEVVPVHVGEQVEVKASPDAQGAAYAGWNVTCDTTLLEFAPSVNLKNPTDTGWIWTMRQTATTTITFQTISPPCNTPPCPAQVSWGTILVLQISP